MYYVAAGTHRGRRVEFDKKAPAASMLRRGFIRYENDATTLPHARDVSVTQYVRGGLARELTWIGTLDREVDDGRRGPRLLE